MTKWRQFCLGLNVLDKYVNECHYDIEETLSVKLPVVRNPECVSKINVFVSPEHRQTLHWPWASYQIRKIAGCACAGNAGNVFPRRRFQRKLLVSDPGMHHGTCVTHVPWCMSGSLTCGDGENVPGIPSACAPAILRIWQEAHVTLAYSYFFLFENENINVPRLISVDRWCEI